MKPETASRILSLNHQFYQSFAEDFSETRQRLQPGVLSLVNRFQSESSILDLGCGNGELARELARKDFSGSYLGTDFSSNLLQKAGLGIPAEFPAEFLELDLSETDWSGLLPGTPFDVVLSFAALHHVPGHEGRKNVCNNIRRHISDQGCFFHSNWQFLRSPRLLRRIIPWNEAGFSEKDLDEGDYLLDWRRGGMGTRYVHHFTPEELSLLADESGFRIKESFFSDGKEGDLSIYQVWEPV
ncbi:MAG: methyltransferase domain-containing protein [Anaerolineales bacterium]|nr:methyltransferase domain-containing protein [Anaerolineales bacterium]